MRRLALAPLFELLVTAAAGGQSSTAFDSIDRYMAAELRRDRIPGVSVAVLRGDSVVLARGYGYANFELRVPTSDSSVPVRLRRQAVHCGGGRDARGTGAPVPRRPDHPLSPRGTRRVGPHHHSASPHAYVRNRR